MDRWEKLREWVDRQPRRGGPTKYLEYVKAEMDRLEREETAAPCHDSPCVTRMGSTYAYLADGTKIVAHRDPDATGKMWIAHEDQAKVRTMGEEPSPVPVPSVEAPSDPVRERATANDQACDSRRRNGFRAR